MALGVELFVQSGSQDETFHGVFDFVACPSIGDQVEIPEADGAIWIHVVTAVTHKVVPLPRVTTTRTGEPKVSATIRFVRTVEV